MQFTFVRHAQPAWERDGLSVTDPPLTERGVEQAALLGERFQGVRADVLYVSPLLRARQTAEPVAEALGLEPVVLPWLAEITSPPWDGTPVEQVERAFAEARTRPLDDLWDGLPGGETFRGFHRRVTSGLQHLIEQHGNERIHDDPALWHLANPDAMAVLVAHSGTNATAVGYLLGVEPVPWEWERFVSLHASVSEMRPVPVAGEHAYGMWRFSDVSHLPEPLHTW